MILFSHYSLLSLISSLDEQLSVSSRAIGSGFRLGSQYTHELLGWRTARRVGLSTELLSLADARVPMLGLLWGPSRAQWSSYIPGPSRGRGPPPILDPLPETPRVGGGWCYRRRGMWTLVNEKDKVEKQMQGDDVVYFYFSFHINLGKHTVSICDWK